MSKQSRRPTRRDRATRGKANLSRRHPHRHRDWSMLDPALEPDADVAVQIAWYGELEDREEAQRSTHDALIDGLGPARRGPVRWLHFEGIDQANQVLVNLAEDGPAHADYVRRIRAHFREWGGFLVVAYARGDRDAAAQ